MQLTCAPVSKRDENTRSFTFILKVVPFVFPVFIKIPLFPLCCYLPLQFHSSLLVRPMNFPIFRYFRSRLASMQLFPSGLQLHQKAWMRLLSVISFTWLLLFPCFLSSSCLSFMARSNCLKKLPLNSVGT